MKKLFVNLKENSYPIFINSNYEVLLECLNEYCSNSKIIIISDTNVDYYHWEELASILKQSNYDIYKYVFEAGEKSKNLNTVENIYKFLLELKVDKDDVLIAFGGGVVGDLTGFIAATYLRGIKFVQVPTTLLSQVDSSVGGKVGVNLNNSKNIVGAFYQPKFVYINTNTLKTLPIRELRSGLAEVIVHCVIKDGCLFDYIGTNLHLIFEFDSDVLEHVISRNCLIKIAVVEQDEREQGLRAILNFGHTIGHAIESAYNFELLHGECVAIGIVGAFKIACNLGITDECSLHKVMNIFGRVGLPCFLDGLDVYKVFNQMLFDKKILNNTFTFILPKGIGQVIKCSIENNSLIKKVLKEISVAPVNLEDI